MPDPTTDFSIFDNRELVTYVPATDPAVENVAALRRPLTQSVQRNVERYVELAATDIVLHLDGAPLATTALAAGDTIADAGGQHYLVLFVERQTLNNTAAVVGRPVEV